MALTDELGVELQGVKVSELENQIKSGGIPPVGMHHAVLSGFREVNANSGRKGRELKFKIIAGPGKDFEVKETVWNSDKAAGKSRVLIFAHRLGIYQRAGDALVPVPGRTEFSDVIGTQCVINVKHEEREYETDKGEKRKVTDVILDFEGVLALDDPRTKDVPRAGAGQVAVASQAATVAAATAAATADKYAAL
ncbi:hypothetical protein R5W24_004465 [Gemmata sp. JC717]|uniref:hypothetical protein n=1 Tax=Gemmata algarum TaxID=2975278 RepID=UPI0021BB9ECE|nr:hypothetical protein [Gemmata algarum]MDY3555323.1 hypothetical protein [Gemmata algarum]